ncbi:alcohol dehydrogenase [Fusarium denticulatum]|uniref:Alcohol dehydrogenase n=1 Tax=Fusarium denticulatum TaxID=48507 RepID=A0A8H5UBI5_9HYPO|nr:alcohol dehydrogenase [Fusarium denticulatum]
MSLPQNSTQWVVKRFDGPSGLEMQVAPIPQLGPNDVMIKIHAISLNYHDVGTTRGHYEHSLKDVVPVSDGSGVIIAIGSDVQNFQIGDRVTTIMNGAHQSGPMKPHYMSALLGNAYHGVLQEYVVVPAQYAIALPRNLSFIEGSTLPVAGLTAWNALFGAQGRPLRPGQWVLTQGTGGVSTFVILVIRQGSWCQSHCDHVLGRKSQKAKKLEAMGADHVINYREVGDWGAHAQALTPGEEGVDIVVEIGGGATLKQSLVAVKMDGLISVVGVRAGTHPKEQPVLMDMFFRFCTTRIAYVGPRVQFEEMNRAIEANNIKPVVDGRVFSLEEARGAFEYLESMKHFGKVCIEVVKSV